MKTHPIDMTNKELDAKIKGIQTGINAARQSGMTSSVQNQLSELLAECQAIYIERQDAELLEYSNDEDLDDLIDIKK